MQASRKAYLVMGAAIAALTLGYAPLAASPSKLFPQVKSRPSFRMSGIGSFTPAAADARRALSFGSAGIGDMGFRFTPSARPGARRAVTVAIRARTAVPARVERAGQAPGLAALAPSAYNLGVSMGWKHFAVTGDVARVQGALLPLDREAADVGVSYSGLRWSTRLQLGAERALGARARLASADESYSVDLGGSYALSSRLAVTGGVRYKMERDRLEALSDQRRDSQAVYIGTAFKF